jgi:hypothetical protein
MSAQAVYQVAGFLSLTPMQGDLAAEEYYQQTEFWISLPGAIYQQYQPCLCRIEITAVETCDGLDHLQPGRLSNPCLRKTGRGGNNAMGPRRVVARLAVDG